MSYFPTISIKDIRDSGNLDAFGRLRVSEPFSQFDSKQIDGNALEDLKFVTSSIAGGSSSYDQTRASQILSVPAVSGAKYTRQSRRYWNYQPGKSLLVDKTFVLGTGSVGIVKRVGYFDDNNGIYLEQSGSDVNLVLRSSTGGVMVENRVSQSVWSENTFDDLDITKAQIFEFDFQWLGVGRVRTGFYTNSGTLRAAHEFNHANEITGVYLASPNLPIREEIENYTGDFANSLESICSAVVSEGGFNPIGAQFSIDRDVSAKTLIAGEFKPVLSMRLVTGSQGTNISITGYSFFATSNNNFAWRIYLNPSYSTPNTGSWNPVTGSSVEYSLDNDGTISGGVVIDSGYGAGGANRIETNISVEQDFTIGWSVAGVSDEFVLAAQPLTTNTPLLAQLYFKQY